MAWARAVKEQQRTAVALPDSRQLRPRDELDAGSCKLCDCDGDWIGCQADGAQTRPDLQCGDCPARVSVDQGDVVRGWRFTETPGREDTVARFAQLPGVRQPDLGGRCGGPNSSQQTSGPQPVLQILRRTQPLDRISASRAERGHEVEDQVPETPAEVTHASKSS